MKNIENVMSNRLKMITATVRNCQLLYDIGTDHAYVPIAVLQKKIAEKAVASDVKKGPLLIADKNIKKYHQEDFIVTEQYNGLEGIKLHADCVIIAGMGGILISQLIKNQLEKAKTIKQLIIQAMNAEEVVRKFLLDEGFYIESEDLTREGKKIYNVMSVSYKGKKESYDEYEYYTSKWLVKEKHELLSLYVKPKIKRCNDIIKGQRLSNTVDHQLIEVKEKMEEIINECT